MSTISIGQMIDKYRILAEVGEGGMATVYRARDTLLERDVALKLMDSRLARDQGFRTRFLTEARAIARLKHPNIVTIYEIGQFETQPFIVMEFIEGQTLADIIQRQGALPLAEVDSIVGQVASALDYAHQRGIIHRDIKPGNILIGPGQHVTLTDFGLVKVLEASQLTQVGTVLGTPAYMSPEQVQGQDLGPASDLYSLGVVAFEMLTGLTPFRGETSVVILHHHVYTPLPPMRAINPRIAPAVEAAVSRALAKQPASRYPSVGAFAEAFHAAATTGGGAAVPPGGPVIVDSGGRGGRSALPWILASVVAALVLIASAVMITRAMQGGGATGTPTALPSTQGSQAPTAPQVTVSPPSATTAPAVGTTATPPPTPSPEPPTATVSPTAPPTETAAPTATATDTALPTDTPAPTDTPTPAPVACVPNARFIEHVQTADGATVGAGAKFTKTWRIQNIGNCPWTPTFKIAYVGGAQMGGPAVVVFGITQGVGEVNTVSVINLVAPAAPGSYSGTWRMQTPDGVAFGDPLVVNIVVAPPVSTFTPTIPRPLATLTPTLTSVPTEPRDPIIQFWADKTKIKAGECTTLRWRVYNVQSMRVMLGNTVIDTIGSNREMGIDVRDKEVCPTQTSTYVLKITPYGGSEYDAFNIKITVE